MTTVTIDDDLATRLRALRNGGDGFNRVVAEALAETVRRWEWEAAGRAEIRAVLNGPRHTPAEADERARRKYGLPDLSHRTDDELMDQAEATLAALPPSRLRKRNGLVWHERRKGRVASPLRYNNRNIRKERLHDCDPATQAGRTYCPPLPRRCGRR